MKPSSPTSDTSSDSGLESLLTAVRNHHPNRDTSLIEKAYRFSEALHEGQQRSSGESYIQHPVAVATILAELKLDTATIVTGLLHDTVEDTHATREEISAQFGPEIGNLVDGVTKISQISFQTSEEKQAENFRKMILAMAQDIRVILVKLADRLHNMRTLQFLKPEKQVRIAQETLDIYAPLANRLGLSAIKRELEDLSLRFTHPEIYYKIVSHISKKAKEREQYTQDLQTLIETALRDQGYPNAQVSGRPKHFYSIHKKMERRNLSFDQIYDITGFRVIVPSIEECYGVLGVIHSIWTPVPGRFKDYIAIPKANFYQSLHTTVIGPDGEKIEIQIRTQEMHDMAERGIAAHWAYKEGKTITKETDKFNWLNRLVEWNRDLSEPNEFLETVKLDLFSEDVYVFTPQGKVLEFPKGATPLDFAFAIHTELGNKCIGAKVNNRMVPLKYRLKSGDTIEVLTSPNQHPNKDWLKLVKTSRARNKIRAFIKAEEHEHSKATGELILEKELKREDLRVKKMLQDGTLEKISKELSFRSCDDLLSAIGYGKISVRKVLNKIVPKDVETPPTRETPKSPLQRIFEEAKKKEGPASVKVRGVDDLLVRFARCCAPVPGDPVVGFITRGRGISVHSRKCPKVFQTDPHRLVEIEWDKSTKQDRKVKIRVVCSDRPGLLADMSNAVKEQNINITRAQIGTTKDKKAVCHFTIEIRDTAELRKLLSHLEAVPGVILAERVQRKEID
ncbi:MAG: RelA/SpoT family protein [Pseudomonadota bacterium]